MRVTTSKSKTQNLIIFQKALSMTKGVSTSVIVRKLGTLNDLLKEHGPGKKRGSKP